MREVIGDMSMVGSLFFGNSVQAQRQFNQEQEHYWNLNGRGTFVSYFEEQAKMAANQFISYEAEQRVNNAMSAMNNFMLPDAIYRFTNMQQFQMAKPQMQKYVMAEPTYRKRYHQGLADGYSDTYVDPAPGVIGAGHEEYEHVMSGVMDVGDGGEWSITHYGRAWKDAEQQHLTAVAQAAVVSTWRSLSSMLEESDDDPGNPWGGRL